MSVLLEVLKDFMTFTWKKSDDVASFMSGLSVIVGRIESCDSDDVEKVNDKWIMAKTLSCIQKRLTILWRRGIFSLMTHQR